MYNEYNEIKKRLAKETKEKLTYFTKSAFNTIMTDRKNNYKAWINNKPYDLTATFETDFYQKSGFQYCVLLEILNELEKKSEYKYKVEYYKHNRNKYLHSDLIDSFYIFVSEKDIETYVNNHIPNNADYGTFEKVL